MENMELNRSFWSGKPVFMTGHTGFKGGWISLWLQHMGVSLYGYALEPSERPCLYYEANVGDGMQSFLADVRDGAKLQSAMGKAKPEIAFHFAAQPLVRESYRNPADTYATNVMGTVNFLEAVRRTPSVRVAIVVTSDKCYENREWQRGYREGDAMGGSDPYSSSKGCSELVATAYRRSFFNDGRVALASVRAGNVIGGGDWAEDRLIPDLVRAFSTRQALRLRYPGAVRPWQHVLEPLRGYLMLAERLWDEGAACSGGWNFGPRGEDARTVIDVVKTAAKMWGAGAEWCINIALSPHEANVLRLDCSLARSRLGWTPVIGLEETLEWTISWYRAHLEGSTDMRRFTVQQVESYENLLITPALRQQSGSGALS